MSEHSYTVIYAPLTEGGFQIIVPALTGLISFGRTMQEARAMAYDAIVCHLHGLLKDSREIPENPFAPEQPIIDILRVSV